MFICQFLRLPMDTYIPGKRLTHMVLFEDNKEPIFSVFTNLLVLLNIGLIIYRINRKKEIVWKHRFYHFRMLR